MSTITPPATTPPPPSTTVQNAATAVVVKAPPALQTIPPGQAVQATVTTTPQGLQIQVQTAFGPITLQTSMALPKGADLTLVLTSLKPPIFQLAFINGKAVPGSLTAAQAKAAGLTLPNSAPNSASTTSPQLLQNGTKLDVVLLRSAQAASTTPGQTSNPTGLPQPATTILSGTQQAQTQNKVQATALGKTTSAPIAAPSQEGAKGVQPALTPQATLSGTGAFAKASGSASQNLLPSGTRFSVTVVRIDGPSAAANPQATITSKGLAQGQTITGTIIGRTPQGRPIVQTPNAILSLGTKFALTDGAKVTLKFDTGPTFPSPSSAAQSLGQAAVGPGLINAKSWEDFNGALKSLASLDPPRFQNVIQTALPQPGARLNNQILFFLSALKGGDLKSLFGDTATRLLTKERPALMTRLNHDFQTMSSMTEQPQSGDWRLALIPLWNGDRLEQVRLYQRGGSGDDKDDNNNDDEGTRFVLDLDLSNLGHLQIDGLMKSSHNRLDLILRTEQPLPETMRGDIASIAETAQNITGLSVSISFQARPEDFVQFPPNALPEQGLLA